MLDNKPNLLHRFILKKKMMGIRLFMLWASSLLPVCSPMKDLYLMGLIPMTGDTWPGGGVCLPPMEMAIRHVNEREDILPGYRLNLIWKDTAVNMLPDHTSLRISSSLFA